MNAVSSPPPPPLVFSVMVKASNGESRLIEISSDSADTVYESLQRRIETKMGVEPARQCLLLEGGSKRLSNSNQLMKALEEGDVHNLRQDVLVIQLIRKLFGGRQATERGTARR
jgi:hypothetical protein